MIRYAATALLASLGFAAGVSGRAGPEPADALKQKKGASMTEGVQAAEVFD